MSWIFILIGLLPDIIDLVIKIWGLIKRKPVSQRRPLRRELFAIARKHVSKRPGKEPVLKTAGVDVRAELEEFLDKLA